MQLSRRGWNNILIFAVLAMMMIFQYSGNRLSQTDSAAHYQSPLPAGSVILSMHFDNVLIRRVGSQLEAQPALVLSQPQLQQIIQSWEGATFKPVPADVQVANLAYGINIVFELANVTEPITLILYQMEDGYLLQNWQQQLLQLDASELHVLLPR